MSWIVLGEEKGKIKLVSKTPKKEEVPGLLPKGSYLTVEPEEMKAKFILRVDRDNFLNSLNDEKKSIIFNRSFIIWKYN